MLWFLCFSHIFDLNSCSSTDHPLVATVEDAGSLPAVGIMLLAVAAMYCAAADCMTADPRKVVFYRLRSRKVREQQMETEAGREVK